MNYGYDNQYSTTSYSAQGGAGGGGFIPGDGSQGTPGGRDKFAKEALRPVTIKQINDAEVTPASDSEFRIDGAEITQITFVGQVRNVSTQATNITYKLDDGTGTVEVKVWVEVDDSGMENSEKSKPKVQENQYARVWGRLKQFNNKRHVGAVTVRQVTDFNEVSFHMLEATVVHLYHTKGPLGSVKKEEGMDGANGAMGGQAFGGMQAGGIANGVNVSAAARRVLNHLTHSKQSNEGLHMQKIASDLGMDSNDVAKAGDELLTNGLIYTTVDDYTWALLDLS